MRSITFIIALIFPTLTAYAQGKLPVIESHVPVISIRDGGVLHKLGWRLAPEINPDVYEAQLINGKIQKVTFITDVDSISFTVEIGKKYDFIIRKGDELCYTQIVGTRYIPAAVFGEEYRASHSGKIFIEIPEVYELVNVALALTPTFRQNKYMVYKDSEYYTRMRQWFDTYSAHGLIASLDSVLQRNLGFYNGLKNNGYAFEFDQRGEIVQSEVYDRIGFEGSNSLRPHLAQLQSFADESNFLKFYKENRQTYQDQIAFYRDTLHVSEMIKWLERNFPNAKGYDSYKIILSPLVYGWQNSIWLESNGFKELQAHVNFPYPKIFSERQFSKQAEPILRGETVFTEFNHGYINPEAEKYAERIAAAVSNRQRWVDTSRGPDYYAGSATFLEYLNWGLIDLLAVDWLPRDQQDSVISMINQTMIEGRDFIQFDAFSRFLVDIYRNKIPAQTVADLYPDIIGWFEKHNN